MIRVIILRPLQPPTVEGIDSSLSSLQTLVGGYIELARVGTPAGEVDLYFNEDGKARELEPNRWVPWLDDAVLGTIVVSSAAFSPTGDMVSFTDDEIARILPAVNAWPMLKPAD